ncbi:MAG: hypothetical protein AB1813_07275 [Verrucomicrobiota bacterium]
MIRGSLLLVMANLLSVASVGASSHQFVFAEGHFENRQRTITVLDAVDRPPDSAGFATNRVANLDSRSVAIWAGGNAGPLDGQIPSASVVMDGSPVTVQLAHSAFGQIVAGPLGYLEAGPTLRAEAASLVRAGASYRYTEVNGKPIGLLGGAFDIRFEGALRPTGEVVPASDPQINYFEDKIRDAEARFRAALRIHPFDGAAARGLVSTFEERMIPLNFAGNAALVALVKARLGNANALLREIPLLTSAADFFRRGAAVMVEATGSAFDAKILENLNPRLKDQTTNEVSRLVDTYIRGLAQWAETHLRSMLLGYQADFRDPLRGQAPSPMLLEALDSGVAEIQGHLLLAGAFRDLPVFNFTDAPKTLAVLQDLSRLREAILRGQINFVAGSGGANSPDLSRRYGEFTTDYVPFFAGDSQDQRSNFRRALDLAETLVRDADDLQKTAEARIAVLENATYENQVVQEDLRARYNGELVELCGTVANDPQGNPIPDYFFATLPPNDRERLGREIFGTNQYPSSLGQNSGLIYQQWISVESARTQFQGAALDLENLFKEMQKKEEIAKASAQGQRRIAYLIQANGEKIVALDRQAGEIQAEIARSLAEVQADLAVKQGLVSAAPGFTKATFSTIAAVGSGQLGDWADAAEGAASAGASIANGFLSAAAARESGRIQADGARRLAEIQAQKDRIAALERAEIQFEAANEIERRLAEALFTLQLQAERQRLNILLTRQSLAIEQDKLATLFARAGRLVTDYFRAISLRNQNDPRLSPDYRVARDAAVRQAEDAFLLAQQWTFVAAQAFYYLDNRPASSTTNYVARVLACRNTAGLQAVLNGLKSEDAFLRSSYQSSRAYKTAVVSLRHQLIQHNRLRDANLPIAERYIYEPTLEGSGYLASRDAWRRFLEAHVSRDERGRPQSLSIPFALSLDNMVSPDLGLQLNPLYDETLFGLLIFSGTDINGAQHKGVRINFAIDGQPEGGSFTGGQRAEISVDLEQRGRAFIRSSARFCDDSNVGLRMFNLPIYNGRVSASINNLEALSGTDAFQERSPANTEWGLTIRAGTSANNGLLLLNLGIIEDIELQIFAKGFQDQNCLVKPRP